MYVVITTGPEVIVVVDVRVVAGVPVSMGTHCSYQMLPCVSTLVYPATNYPDGVARGNLLSVILAVRTDWASGRAIPVHSATWLAS
jgi:hypothetical protein